jgi:small subunit ribosomal protein S9
VSKKVFSVVGKRKTSVARVVVKEGKGAITVNKKDFNDYFTRETAKMIVKQPLRLVEIQDKVDVIVNVVGGGLSGQAGAIRHGIARALSEMNPEYRTVLKAASLITRDARKKERKMYGRKAARARFQFSKR